MGLPPKDGMDVGSTLIEGSGIEGTIVGSVGLGCGYGINCDLGPVIFLLASSVPFSFLGRTSGIIF